MNNIAQIIKNKRLFLNLTMDYVANKLNISRATLSSIENGSLKCSFDLMLKILNFLEINLKIDENMQINSNRERATKMNTLNQKKINSFIVMCIEQYSLYINDNSENVYKKMKEKNVIKNLSDDYEDLHGMSTHYLNDYITKLLGN